MSFIEATLSGETAVLARFEKLPDNLRSALVESMRRQWFRIQTEVVRGKLSGDPLHRRTGVLASSINVGQPDTASEFVDEPTQIVGRIGTKVKYGVIHEEGGTFQVPAHTRNVTSVFGRSVVGKTAEVRAHAVTFPKRSFLRSTLNEMRGSVIAAIEADIAKATQEA